MLLARARIPALLAHIAPFEDPTVDCPSIAQLDIQEHAQAGDVVAAGWDLLCNDAPDSEARFARWAAHDSTVTSIPNATCAPGLVAAHRAMLVHLAAAAAAWHATRGAPTAAWLCGLAGCVRHWQSLLTAPSLVPGWVAPSTLLSVAQWARDEALWTVHALRALGRIEGVPPDVARAGEQAASAVRDALRAARVLVEPQVGELGASVVV